MLTLWDRAVAFDFQYSLEYDLYNQGEAVKHFEKRFYANGGSLSDEELAEVDFLRRQAVQEPILALAAAQVLYMFGWFRSTGEVLRANVRASAELFEQSISVANCSTELLAKDWTENACDIRWMHAAMLYDWLGRTEKDPKLKSSFLAAGQAMADGLRITGRYAGVSDKWVTPQHMSYNSVIFVDKLSKPIWPHDQVPLGKWLEEKHAEFKMELDAILREPGLFEELMAADPSREHLGSPGGWDSIRVVRYHHWYDAFCSIAPRTCELVKERPEIIKCPFMNVNYMKLHPGAHLKPHFGNGPRLSAHLPVIAPEPLKAAMSVGTERVLWVEGEATIFDDTFPHSVSHWGAQPRYVLLVWFCHPCDWHEHGQRCFEA